MEAWSAAKEGIATKKLDATVLFRLSPAFWLLASCGFMQTLIIAEGS
jgi:hypothetical protein